jgi:adenylate kinase
MLIWATGISGSQRTEYLRRVASLCDAPQKAEVIHVADFLRDLPSSLRILDEQQMTRLLDASDAVRKMHVRGALLGLEKKLDTMPTEAACIVSTHACFLRDGRLRPGLEMALLKRLFAPRIDMLVTVIDSCDEVWGRLHQRPEWQDQLELLDIAVWRDIEITMTRMIAEYEGKPFFLLARRDGPESLYRICTDPDARRIYLSYPISNILKEKRELFERAQALAEQLRRAGYVVFNPISIQDVPGTRALLPRVTAVEVPPEQVEPAKRYLDSETMSRDFQLIDQADMVVAYYPSTDVSTGVMAELTHARDTHKQRYSCGYEGRRSPFDKYIFGEMLPDEGALVARLNELYKTRAGTWNPRADIPNVNEHP